MQTVARSIVKNVTIANGGTTSDAAVVLGQVVGVHFADFTGATVSFTTCDTEAGTFVPVHNSSGLYTVNATDNAILNVDPTVSQAFLKYVKVVSVQAEAAERTVGLIVREWS